MIIARAGHQLRRYPPDPAPSGLAGATSAPTGSSQSGLMVPGGIAGTCLIVAA